MGNGAIAKSESSAVPVPIEESQLVGTQQENLYQDFASKAFSESQRAILLAFIKPEDLDVLPTGEVYLSQIKYRDRLNEAFGPGAWGLRPMSKALIKDNCVMRDYALYINGRIVSQSVGESEYLPNNPRMSYATAIEAAKSNALMRCCKDIGIASECWDHRFTEQFKAAHCVQVWRKNQVRPQWRLKTAEPWLDETGGVDPKQPQLAPSSDRHQPQPDAPSAEDGWLAMKAKYPSRCVDCQKEFAVGTDIYYNRAEKSVLCLACYKAPNAM